MRHLAIATTVLVCTACGGPYGDLEAAFRASEASAGRASPSPRVVLVSTKHRGAHSFNGVLALKLLPSAAELEPSFPVSLIMETVRIPVEKISGCSKTCFGPGTWDANLLVAGTGTEIS